MTRLEALLASLRFAGLAPVWPVERRNAPSATTTTPETPQGATAADQRCRYGWRSTCGACELFGTCEPPRLQRFLERRSLIGMRRRGLL